MHTSSHMIYSTVFPKRYRLRMLAPGRFSLLSPLLPYSSDLTLPAQHAIPFCCESKVVMGTTKHTNLPFCLLFLFLLSAILIPGGEAGNSAGSTAGVLPGYEQLQQNDLMKYSPMTKYYSVREFQAGNTEGGAWKSDYLKRWQKKKKKKGGAARRLMIGSTAPICTYNECRGCKYRCRAEQIPVDANDPINSAYHYRCVCHR